MAIVPFQVGRSELYGEDRDAPMEERYYQKHPKRSMFTFAPDHTDPLAVRAGTLPHEWFISEYDSTRLTERMIRAMCQDVAEQGVFALRVLISLNYNERQKWRHSGFRAAETGLTPDGGACVHSDRDIKYVKIANTRRERLICVLRGVSNIPTSSARPNAPRAVEDEDNGSENESDDSPRGIERLITWKEKESTVLFYDAMFGFGSSHSEPPMGDPVVQFALPMHPVRFDLLPWSHSLEAAIVKGAQDVCSINEKFVIDSIRKADLVLFASEPMDDSIQSIVTVFSGFKGEKRKCLSHEWYIDVACSATGTRALVKLFEILRFMAYANQIQAIRLHSTRGAYSYWTQRRMFRPSETIRDATGRCHYSVPVPENAPDEPYLTRLVLVITETTPPPPQGDARHCILRNTNRVDNASETTLTMHDSLSGDESDMSSSISSSDDGVIRLPWRVKPPYSHSHEKSGSQTY